MANPPAVGASPLPPPSPPASPKAGKLNQNQVKQINTTYYGVGVEETTTTEKVGALRRIANGLGFVLTAPLRVFKDGKKYNGRLWDQAYNGVAKDVKRKVIDKDDPANPLSKDNLLDALECTDPDIRKLPRKQALKEATIAYAEKYKDDKDKWEKTGDGDAFIVLPKLSMIITIPDGDPENADLRIVSRLNAEGNDAEGTTLVDRASLAAAAKAYLVVLPVLPKNMAFNTVIIDHDLEMVRVGNTNAPDFLTRDISSHEFGHYVEGVKDKHWKKIKEPYKPEEGGKAKKPPVAKDDEDDDNASQPAGSRPASPSPLRPQPHKPDGKPVRGSQSGAARSRASSQSEDGEDNGFGRI